MKVKLLFLGFCAMIGNIFGCSAQTTGFKSMSAEDFEKAIADTAIVRLDVRTVEEYTEGHIANTINIDVLKDDFEEKALQQLPKGKTLAVYCRGGNRSKKAAQILVKNGFEVVELDTGYKGWVAAGKPVTK